MNNYYNYTQRQQKKRRFSYFIFLLIKFFLILFIIWLGIFFYWVHNLPTTEPSDTKAQSIVVLTGARGRLPKAAELLEQTYASRLLISGVNPIVSSKELFEQLPKLSYGLKNKIDIGRVAGSTIGNALEAKGWMRQNNFQSAIIVTSNWHIQRSMLEFKHIMPETRFIPYHVISDVQKNGGRYWYLNKEWVLRLSKEFAKLSIRWIHFKLNEIF